ncbi:hypothetical protein EJ419_04065 [Alloscardovia theropitheci]|uniref:Uncharacterized protein n=1 Tax=Alloscardovia theropitheci TaxID=2496842 RepID=A0A4R0QZU9_9BIFI|nr:hypothetical protein [Alloscardovia theropitheci]TCD54226.1 hypothetical protein EJ419_04065 [Alloscardovia theropitheci]
METTPTTQALSNTFDINAVSCELPEQNDSSDSIVGLKSRMTVSVYHKQQELAGAHNKNLDKPSLSENTQLLKRVEDFPGPMCLRHLSKAQVLTQLDSHTYFSSRYNASCEKRALIVKSIIPFGSIASGQLAAWIWLGNEFPRRIDITRENHYHSILFGRNVKSTSRQIHRNDLREFPQLLVTTPARTVCDLACDDDLRCHPYSVTETIYRLVLQYCISERMCMEIMRQNTRKPHYTAGLNLLLRIFAKIRLTQESKTARIPSIDSHSGITPDVSTHNTKGNTAQESVLQGTLNSDHRLVA